MWEYVLIPHQQGLDVGICSQDCMWEYVMCICDTVLWSIKWMCFVMILRCDYICIKWFIICSGIIIFDIFEWVCEKSIYSALLDSILLCILYNYLLNVWLTPSITVFRLKCSWKYRTFGLLCKVQGRAWKL